jgi:5-methyltetrahydrofolate corrinoid/iron sulfur protein methyltransferase
MDKFLIIGERIHCISPEIRNAIETRNPEAIFKRAKEQLAAGAQYLDLNIGPASRKGEEIMQWAVQAIQNEFDNVPLALDTTNRKAMEAGLKVYNRSKGKPIVNSADTGDRIELIDLAAANAIFAAMAIEEGLSSAIINPCNLRLMETIKTCDVVNNVVLYADSYLNL